MCLLTNRDPSYDRYPVEMRAERIVLGVDLDEQMILTLGGVARSLPRIVRLLRRTRSAIREREISTIVSLLTTANLLAILAGWGLPVRVVISERNDTTQQRQSVAVRTARWLLYRFADVVTANSQVSLDDMRRYVPDRKLTLVPNAVVVPAHPAAPQDSRTILTVGRLVDHKQHALVIEAFAATGDVASGWSLDLAGDGAEQTRLEELAARLGLTDRVRFLGYVADPSLAYQDAGIFVLASRYEGTPNSLLEAMAAGVPCVVADGLPAALSVVEDGVSGLVFRAGEARDLADKMVRLMHDPGLRMQLGSEARRRMHAFSPDRVNEVWHQVLR